MDATGWAALGPRVKAGIYIVILVYAAKQVTEAKSLRARPGDRGARRRCGGGRRPAPPAGRRSVPRDVTGRGHRPELEIRPAQLGNMAGLMGAADPTRR